MLTLLLTQVPPFSARFERVIIEDGIGDTARGRICFAAPWRIYYDVDYPLNQQLSVVKSTMTIYYPDDNNGFIIRTKSQFDVPLSQPSMSAVNPVEQMPKLGFKPAEMTTSNDTIYATWVPKNPKQNPNPLFSSPASES